MNEKLIVGLESIVPIVGLISGLVGAYVSLQNRALLAEVRKELAELENRIILRINGTYARNAECALRHDNVHTRLEALTNEVREVIRPGLHREEP